MRKTTQLKHSSTPGLEADIMRSLVITANDDNNSQSNDRPTLPAELISKIILELQQDRQYAVLAKMAQVNSTFYDLVIPKLYETITITEDNKYVISHGIHPSQHHRWIIFLDENGIDQDYIEPPPEGYKTRKDRAFECCVRLIVDTPVEDLVQSMEDIVDLLPQDRLGNVEELVFTGRAPMRTTYDDVVYDLAQILPPFTPVMAADEFNQLPRTKRVILHIVADDFRRESPRWIIRPLAIWCKHRRHHRRPAEFVIYNLDLGEAEFHFNYMNVQCHFYPYEELPGELADDFFVWVSSLIRRLEISASPRLKSFDVNTFLFTDEDRPTDRTEALEQINSAVSRQLGLSESLSSLSAASRAELVNQIMGRISFHESVQEQQQYPISRPSPVRPPV